MSERKSGFGPGFNRDIEAILSTVQLGYTMGQVFLYPHEVRENLRMAGMRVDQNLPEFAPATFDFDNDYEPDFGEPDEEPYDDDDPEGDDNE